MVEAPVGLALAAGVLAAVNPCGFALLPAYLGLLVRGEAGATSPSLPAAVGRALAAAGAMTLGFAAVFGAFGLVISPVAGQVQRHLPWFTIGLGLVVLAVGLWLLVGRAISIPGIRPGGGPAVRRTVPSMALFGAAYAVASLSCTIGPFLATVIVTFRTGSFSSGVAVFLAYAAGMGLAVGAAALTVALSRDAVPRGLRRWGPRITRIGGGPLAAAGAYVAYYGWYEIRVLRGGEADDPVVGTAEQVQRWLANGLSQLGVGWLAVLVGVLTLTPLLVAAERARRRHRAPSRTPCATSPPAAGDHELWLSV
ncbi:MAG: cytochrome c biogenesis protein CcdA [Micromonosporaceae bacterium]|nr:cytochrome c biogenesis protein CcdA [Micromonosporaceae bacterium]